MQNYKDNILLEKAAAFINTQLAEGLIYYHTRRIYGYHEYKPGDLIRNTTDRSIVNIILEVATNAKGTFIRSVRYAHVANGEIKYLNGQRSRWLEVDPRYKDLKNFEPARLL